MNFPTKKYKIIYADPPWSYESYSGKSEKDFLNKKRIWGIAESNYETMSIEELKQLPVQSISDDDCILFMWATFPNLQQALDLIKAWGFEYKTVGFVWEKFGKSNNTTKKYGLGWYTRSNAEIVMIGRKGKFDRKSAAVQQIVKSTIGEHSRKPNEVRERILKLCGDLPRIELFARTKVYGWDVWGNDEKLDNQPLETFFQQSK